MKTGISKLVLMAPNTVTPVPRNLGWDHLTAQSGVVHVRVLLIHMWNEDSSKYTSGFLSYTKRARCKEKVNSGLSERFWAY